MIHFDQHLRHLFLGQSYADFLSPGRFSAPWYQLWLSTKDNKEKKPLISENNGWVEARDLFSLRLEHDNAQYDILWWREVSGRWNSVNIAPGDYDSYVSDLFSHEPAWLRIWTGRNDGDGLKGSLVDVGHIYGPDAAPGWIKTEDLRKLKTDVSRLDHNEIWVKPAGGEWQSADIDFIYPVDFSSLQQINIMEHSYADLLDFKPFASEWYRIYTGDEHGAVPVQTGLANGWIQAGELAELTLSAEHSSHDTLWWKPQNGKWQSVSIGPQDTGLSFARLFTHAPGWVRIWTGNRSDDELTGSFVDTGHLYDHGEPGWILLSDLKLIEVDADRLDHDLVRIKPADGEWKERDVAFTADQLQPQLEAGFTGSELFHAGQEFSLELEVSESTGAEIENLAVHFRIAGLIDKVVEAGDPRWSGLDGNTRTIVFEDLLIQEPGIYNVQAQAFADNAQEAEFSQDITIAAQEFSGRREVSIEHISAGRVGSEIEVQAWASHLGRNGQAVFTLHQGDFSHSETIPLQWEQPISKPLSFTFNDTSSLNPGPVNMTVSLSDSGRSFSASQDFALYQHEEEFNWQWADVEQQPYDLIGHMLVRLEDSDKTSMGTGFLISPRHVMTNAHVLSSNSWESDLSELKAAEFYLGRQGATASQEQEDNLYQAVQAHMQRYKWDDHWPDTDMAIITLDREVDQNDGQGHFQWFWTSADDEERDLRGKEVTWSGYPARGVHQGEDDGEGLYFQWSSQGEVDSYRIGHPDYGAQSGGFKLAPDMYGSRGASGSPVFFQEDSGDYYFAGVYAGSGSSKAPLVSALDKAAYNWALSIVQKDGYFLEKELLEDMSSGPSPVQLDSLNQGEQHRENTEVDLMGVHEEPGGLPDSCFV
ncbi:Protein of unknown function DUF316 [Desulfonatronospira thiodismutans ASO3-1]|uniref:Serine protease n=1 Tax=Desulfonatronospira thiodismutans ASO3-1 TaxID=555779 RepID=D6SN76_9BACT|nr:serine protease [Desulfonatronospira thiodismutans]EFI34202.1 Protein of unknown function DUF316 [Desulfonatronospira thiodismutans ASO3-1]